MFPVRGTTIGEHYKLIDKSLHLDGVHIYIYYKLHFNKCTLKNIISLNLTKVSMEVK